MYVFSLCVCELIFSLLLVECVIKCGSSLTYYKSAVFSLGCTNCMNDFSIMRRSNCNDSWMNRFLSKSVRFFFDWVYLLCTVHVRRQHMCMHITTSLWIIFLNAFLGSTVLVFPCVRTFFCYFGFCWWWFYFAKRFLVNLNFIRMQFKTECGLPSNMYKNCCMFSSSFIYIHDIAHMGNWVQVPN